MKTILTLLSLLLPFALLAQLPRLFPGDTNNDSICNYLDLLPIGLAYSATGPPRPGTGVDWEPKDFFPWEFFLPQSGLDYAFADANGLDTINSDDVDVIRLNYDSIQFFPFSDPAPEDYINQLPVILVTPLPQLVIFFSDPIANPLDTIFADIFFMADPTSFPGAMAVALRLNFATDNVEESSPVILFDTLAPDLMGVGAVASFIGIDRSPGPGVGELAVSGYAQNVFTAPRKVATVRIIIDMIIRNQADTIVPFWFEFERAYLMNNAEQLFAVETFSDTLLLTTALHEPLGAGAMRLFPNPAHNRVQLESPAGLIIETVALRNSLGQIITTIHPRAPQAELDINCLPAGLYHAEIQTEKGRLSRNLVVTH